MTTLNGGKMVHLRLVLTLLLTFLIPASALAQVPQPTAVPNDLPPAISKILNERLQEILAQRDSIKEAVAGHNQRCASVPKGSARAEECRKESAELQSRIAS